MDAHTQDRPTIEDTGDHEEDREAIRQILADIEAGFNSKDPELSVQHFAENSHVTNAMGLIQGLSRRFWYSHYREVADLPLAQALERGRDTNKRMRNFQQLGKK
jgi:hypothetical protein